jgi:hypothetical protein
MSTVYACQGSAHRDLFPSELIQQISCNQYLRNKPSRMTFLRQSPTCKPQQSNALSPKSFAKFIAALFARLRPRTTTVPPLTLLTISPYPQANSPAICSLGSYPRGGIPGRKNWHDYRRLLPCLREVA